MRKSLLLLPSSLLLTLTYRAYADSTTITPTFETAVIDGSLYDINGDYPDNSDLIHDSHLVALYASASGTTYPGLLEDGSGNRYVSFRTAVKPQFGQKLLIVFDVNDSAFGQGDFGFDGVVDMALVVDVSAPNQASWALYATGSAGTGCGNNTTSCVPNTRPNNTDFYIDAQSPVDYKINDATIAMSSVGSDIYIDIVFNFDEMVDLLQDDEDVIDDRVVLNPFSDFSESTSVRLALTSSANLNNVNKDISGANGSGALNLLWEDIFSSGSFQFGDPSDSDGDGFGDQYELVVLGTNPNDMDTDDDGLSDSDEVNIFGTNPLEQDSDGDGLQDGMEVGEVSGTVDTNFDPNLGDIFLPDNDPDTTTNPLSVDSDGDGLEDGEEDLDSDGVVDATETDPSDPDTDGDSCSDGFEVITSLTDPLDTDTDGDTLGDCSEVNLYNTSPILADTDEDGLNDNLEVLTYFSNPNLVDSDSDTCTDYEEVITHLTNPNNADSDSDGLGDCQEVNTSLTNPNKADSDSDGLNDYDEYITHGTNPNNADSDSDGLSDNAEISTHLTNPNNPDTDEDGCLDAFEVQTSKTDPNNGDSDADGLGDCAEVNTYQTNPNLMDTDNDGLNDYAEVMIHGTNPKLVDTDSDGLSDYAEIMTHLTDPKDTDSDDDGLGDAAEVNTHSTDPLDQDSDDDGCTDYEEVITYDTDPNLTDSDGDTLGDCEEVNDYQTDPNDVDSDDDGLHDDVEINDLGTNPNDGDSDDDGLSDAVELNNYSTDPKDTDSDDDGCSDYDEVTLYNTNPNLVDTDGDGLGDCEEITTYNTNPKSADSDFDGLNDYIEVNTTETNPNDSDSDDDGLGDGFEHNTLGTDPNDPDTDDDGCTDSSEANVYNTNPNLVDTDGDGLNDCDEVTVHGTNPNNSDTDGDACSDGAEVSIHGTNPILRDTDGDTLSDCDEVTTHNTNPNLADTDGDNCNDAFEVNTAHTNPNLVDTDGDDLGDCFEINTSLTDPNNIDTDGEGLNDGDEVHIYGTNPNIIDTDGDGLSDADEVNTSGTDPANADTDNDGCDDGVEVITMLTNPNSTDTDEDGLGDCYEVNVSGTDPNNIDTDGEGLSDGDEVHIYGTNPTKIDTDGDELSDAEEVNTTNTDPNDKDSDEDGCQDGAEVNTHNTDPNNVDTDGDTLGDCFEINTTQTDPTNVDTDGEGLEDGDEVNMYGTDPNNPDTDGDELTDAEEVQTTNTDPTNPDSDADGCTDGSEVTTHNTDPNTADSDDDGLGDCDEVTTYNTDPNNGDSDNDGCLDGSEVLAYETDPNNTDSDEDGLGDCDEVHMYGTDPNNADSDGDGFTDGQEVNYETSPTTGNEFPRGKYVGGASCSSSTQPVSGWLSMFSILGFLGFRRRRSQKQFSPATYSIQDFVMTLVFLFSSLLRAEEYTKGEVPHFNAQTFRPAIDSYRFLWINDTHLGQNGTFNYRGTVSYASNPVVYEDFLGNRTNLLSSVTQFDASLGFTKGKVRYAISAPIILNATGDTVFLDESPISEIGIGDLFLDVKYQLMDPINHRLGLAFTGRSSVPTSTTKTPLGTDGLQFELEASMDAHLGSTTLALNIGHRQQPDVVTENVTWGPQLYSRIGYAVPFGAESKSGMAVEFNIASLYANMGGGDALAMETMLGGWYSINDLYRIRLGVSKGLSTGMTTPDWRGILSLSFLHKTELDTDGDGVVDHADACLDTPEDKDGFEDEDGCADPTKVNVHLIDHLGNDVRDAHWTTSDGQFSGPGFGSFYSQAGTFEIDVDSPKYRAEPTIVEIFDQKEQDVRIEIDLVMGALKVLAINHNKEIVHDATWSIDGVKGASYRPVGEIVPIAPGMHEVIVQAPGYRMVKEMVEVKAEDVVVVELDVLPSKVGKNLEILDKVNFEHNSHIIKADSYHLLDEVFEILDHHPLIEEVHIEGHTDSEGDDEYNKKLSQQRADEVRNYLIKKGIDAKRLVAIGYGESKPIDTNSTPEGRHNNRRVVFHITKRHGQDFVKDSADEPKKNEESPKEPTKENLEQPK